MLRKKEEKLTEKKEEKEVAAGMRIPKTLQLNVYYYHS